MNNPEVVTMVSEPRFCDNGQALRQKFDWYQAKQPQNMPAPPNPESSAGDTPAKPPDWIQQGFNTMNNQYQTLVHALNIMGSTMAYPHYPFSPYSQAPMNYPNPNLQNPNPQNPHSFILNPNFPNISTFIPNPNLNPARFGGRGQNGGGKMTDNLEMEVGHGDEAVDSVSVGEVVSEENEAASLGNNKKDEFEGNVMPEDDSRGASLYENDLYKDTGSYQYQTPNDIQEIEEINASVSSVTRNLQQLSVGNDDRGLPSEGYNTPSVVIPDHLQVQYVDCSHLSFGSFGSGMGAGYSLDTVKSVPVEPNLEKLHSETDIPSVGHMDRSSDYYVDDSLRNASDGGMLQRSSANAGDYDPASASQHEELKSDNAEGAHESEYTFPPSNPGYTSAVVNMSKSVSESSEKNWDTSSKTQDMQLLSYSEWKKGASHLDFVRRQCKVTQAVRVGQKSRPQRYDYLAMKYGLRWKRRSCKAAQSEIKLFELGSWVTELILSAYSQSIRSEMCMLVNLLCGQSSSRRFHLLNLLMSMLLATLSAGENAAEYFELLFKMIDSEDARIFLTVRGCLSTIYKLIMREVSNVESLERSLHIDISQGFILHKLIELLGKFLEVPNIRSRFMREKLLSDILEALIVIRGLIVQKTKLISDCNRLPKDLLDSLLLESNENKRQFIQACIGALQAHAEDNKVRTSMFILEQLCHLICPSKPEPLYLLILNKAHTQEEFIRGSMTKNPYSSAESDPLMREVKNKICNQLDLLGLVEDDYGMELLVAGNIISLDLSIALVYEQVWKKSNSQNLSAASGTGFMYVNTAKSTRDCPPMTVIYRLQGLDGEATEPMIKELDEDREESQDPEIEFAITAAVRECGGSGDDSLEISTVGDEKVEIDENLEVDKKDVGFIIDSEVGIEDREALVVESESKVEKIDAFLDVDINEEPIEECLRDAKMDKSSVHDVVLVGGSTRILKVQDISLCLEFLKLVSKYSTYCYDIDSRMQLLHLLALHDLWGIIHKMDKYQEQGQLLEPYLESIIPPLMAIVHSRTAELRTASDEILEVVQPICIVIYSLATFCGYKSVIRFFPHQVADLELAVSLLEICQTTKTATTLRHESTGEMKTKCSVLLWLSILELILFHSLNPLVISCCRDGSTSLDSVYYQLENLRQANHPYKSFAGNGRFSGLFFREIGIYEATNLLQGIMDCGGDPCDAYNFLIIGLVRCGRSSEGFSEPSGEFKLTPHVKGRRSKVNRKGREIISYLVDWRIEEASMERWEEEKYLRTLAPDLQPWGQGSKEGGGTVTIPPIGTIETNNRLEDEESEEGNLLFISGMLKK